MSEDLAKKYLSLPPYLREVIRTLQEFKLDGNRNFVTRENALNLIRKEDMAKGTPEKYLWRLTNPSSEYYSPEFIKELDGAIQINDELIPSIIFVNNRLIILLIQVAIISGVLGALFLVPFPVGGIFALGVCFFCLVYYRFLRNMIISKI